MLTLSSSTKLFLYQKPVKMHKSFEGVSVAVEEAFPGELLSGSYFIFLNRLRDHMKVLYWDGDGLAIWYKRLEKGSFLRKNHEKTSINRREFFMLLEGVTPQKIQPRYRVF